MEDTQKKDSLIKTIHFPNRHFNLNSDFPLYGTPISVVNRDIENLLQIDIPYESGKVFGAMSTAPHQIVKDLNAQYCDKNLGDRGLNLGTAMLEKRLVNILGHLLGGQPSDSFFGNMTSGGTESNIMAMYTAKTLQPNITKPNVVLSEAAHYSFEKIARLMNIEMRYIPVDGQFMPDMEEFEAAIDDQTLALVGIAGSSALGLVDPINEISHLAKKYHKYLHIDGAFGGFVLPFLEKLGYSFPLYDFRNPEVCSFSVDPHKMGMNLNPSGILLLRDQGENQLGFEISYLAGGGHKTFNLLGTRPGAPVITFWGLIQSLGFTGFLNIIQQCWENTQYFYNRIQEIPLLHTVCYPQMNVVGITLQTQHPKTDIARLNTYLRELGWNLGYFEKWNLLRCVFMPHIQKSHIDAFLTDINLIVKKHFSPNHN